MAGCTPIEQRAMNSSLQMVVDKIGNRCTDFIEVYPMLVLFNKHLTLNIIV